MPNYSQDVSEIKETLARLDERLGALHEDIKEIKNQLETQNGSIEANAVAIARLQERQGILALFQFAFATVASAIAGWLGWRK